MMHEEKLFTVEVYQPSTKSEGRWITVHNHQVISPKAADGEMVLSLRCLPTPGVIERKVYRSTPGNAGYYELVATIVDVEIPDDLLERGEEGGARPIRSLPFELAAKHAKKLSLDHPNQIFRIRSGKDVLVANIL